MKRILLGSMMIGLVAALISGGVFASFIDTETSTGNTFAAGTMDLQIKDNGESWGDGISETWILDCIVPGANTNNVDMVTSNLYLRRLGCVTPDHVEVTASASLDETYHDVESDTDGATTVNQMAARLEVTHLQYDSLFLVGGTQPNNQSQWLLDADTDGKITLNDMMYPAEQNGLDDLPIPPTPDDWENFHMTVRWIEGDSAFWVTTDNDFQGDRLSVDFIFTLNQDSSQ